MSEVSATSGGQGRREVAVAVGGAGPLHGAHVEIMLWIPQRGGPITSNTLDALTALCSTM